jgi:hypothetical protein
LNSATTLGRINIFHSHFFSDYFRSRETSPPIAAATAAGAVDSKSNLLGGMMTASSLSLQYLEAGFRIHIQLIRIWIWIWIQHFRLNSEYRSWGSDPDPDPWFL